MKKLRRLLAHSLPAFTVLGLVAVVLCFVNQWDQVTPATLIPIWGWACAGGVWCVIAWLFCRSGVVLAVLLGWIAAALTLSDGSRSLYHELRNAVRAEFKAGTPGKEPGSDSATERQVRVIVFEAEGASHDSVWEIARLSPDVVLLQGAPEPELARLAADLFEGEGGYLPGDPCAVLARGKIRKAPLPGGFPGTRALVEWPGGIFLDLVSLRLPESHPRWDFVVPRVWTRQVELRLKNRSTLRDMMRMLDDTQLDEDARLFRLVGGNFATPPGDDIFRHLRSQGLSDVHGAVGTGWGSTYPADHPLLRTDQLWSGAGLVPLSLATLRAGNARHRMLVADFSFGPAEPGPASEPVDGTVPGEIASGTEG